MRLPREQRLKRDQAAIRRIIDGMSWVNAAKLAGITYRQLYNRIKKDVEAARKREQRMAS